MPGQPLFNVDDDPFAITTADHPAAAPAPTPADPPADPAAVPAPAAAPNADPSPMSAVAGDGFAADAPTLAPAQRRTFDDLLALGAERPVAPVGIADDLRRLLEDRTGAAVAAWTEPSLWFGKSALSSAVRCEGLVVAEKAKQAGGERRLHPATAVGIVAHRAVQLCYTHPGRPVAEQVRAAVAGSVRAEDTFAAWWADADDVAQSDLIVAAEGRVTAFVESWPPLDPLWLPRFEQPIQPRVGRLILGTRPDLTLGTARADGRQTMLIVDLKTGALGDHHQLEADFYALAATLRYGVPPFRSVVFSLASGDWTDGDVTADRLLATAETVADAVIRTVDVVTDRRPAALTPGVWCRFCPARTTCPSAST